MRVRSTDGDATLTLATAAAGESAGVEFKADNKVATVRRGEATHAELAPRLYACTSPLETIDPEP